MIFAEKLTQLRKKSGWSQEDLAEQMNVSRQSVSKWEGATSVPDLEKIIRLSELFGVSIDYLLKDEIGEMEQIETSREVQSCRLVSMEEASTFINIKMESAKLIAIGVFLCITSITPLILLAAISEIPRSAITEDMAGGIGVIILLGIIASAVALFLSSRHKTAPYDYLEQEVFETEYGVTGMVKERKERYRETYTKSNVIGAVSCILAIVPIMCGVVIDARNDLLLIIMVSVMFIMIGIGVGFFVCTGIQWAGYEKLLQEGEFTRINKEEKASKARISTSIAGSYWLIATAIYLGISFLTNNWEITWVVWPITALLYPVLVSIIRTVKQRNRDNN